MEIILVSVMTAVFSMVIGFLCWLLVQVFKPSKRIKVIRFEEQEDGSIKCADHIEIEDRGQGEVN